MKGLRSMIAVIACLVIGQLSYASPGDESSKNEGVIHGYVLDALTKKPVPGVVVSAQSGKSPVSKEVATDAAGYFRIKELPTGSMSIAFDKKGYKFIRKESVKVKSGDVIKINVDIYQDSELVPADFEHPAMRLIEGII